MNLLYIFLMGVSYIAVVALMLKAPRPYRMRDVSSIVCSHEHSHRPYNDVLHRREQ